MARLDAEIDRLYQLPLEEFTAARNTLAKEAGKDAPEVHRLRKPPLAAWAINQIFWRNRPVYERLVKAADDLRAAHAGVTAGRPADLRSAGRDHEKALNAALKSALAILHDSGHPITDQTKQAIATTLRALPVAEPPGRLARTLQPRGFDQLAEMPLRFSRRAKAPAGAPRETRTPIERGAKRVGQTAASRAALSKAKDRTAAASRELRDAEHAARREEFEVARLAREAERAMRAADRAREALADAERAVEEADRVAAGATKARHAAERRAHDAADALRSARERLRTAQGEFESLTRDRPRAQR